MENSDTGNNGFTLILKYRYVLMGLAAIWIHIFHVGVPLFYHPANEAAQFIYNIEEFIRRMGYCGVEIFLIISGMGLTYAIKKGSVAHFYKRRLSRIYLPYLIVTLIRWPIDKWTIWMFLENATGLSFYTKDIHHFCWFVPAIATLYLVFPLYYWIFSKAKNKLLFTALAIALWFMITIVTCGYLRFDFYDFTNRIPIFLIGIYFGELSQKQPQSKFTKKHYLIMLAVFVAGLILAYFYNFCDFELIIPNSKTFIPNILLSVSMVFLITKLMDILNRRLPKPGRILTEIISFWGKMSLEMYCAYICFLKPCFLICVRILAGFKFPLIAINITVFILTSCIAFLISLLCKGIRKLIELPGKNKLAKEY